MLNLNSYQALMLSFEGKSMLFPYQTHAQVQIYTVPVTQWMSIRMEPWAQVAPVHSPLCSPLKHTPRPQ